MRIGFMAARSVGLRAFVHVRVRGCPLGPRIRFGARKGSVSVPLEVFEIDGQPDSHACDFAVALPAWALSAEGVTLVAVDESQPFGANGSSASAGLTRMRFDALRVASKGFARGCERVLGALAEGSSAMQGAYELYQTGCFDFGDETVWRIAVEWVGEQGGELDGEPCGGSTGDSNSETDGGAVGEPKLTLLGSDFAPVPFSCTVFESQDGMDAYWKKGQKHRRVYSLRFDAKVKDFCLVASDPCGNVGDGMYLMDAPAADALLRESFEVMKSVEDEEDAYPLWLDAHREASVKAAALASSRASSASFTVVVQDPGGEELLVLQSVESLAGHLGHCCDVVVSCSAGCSVYDGLASDGIRVVKGSATLPPAELYGLGKAHGSGSHVCVILPGDVFEGHAFELLASHADDAASSPGASGPASVLYCDEDFVDEDGVFGRPALKTAFNRDLFYASNWAGRAVFFSGDLLEAYASDAATLNLASYALCLEAIRRDASFRHVPHVLLHKHCESLGSMNAGAQGFEASELEKAKRLLSGHFEKIGQPLHAADSAAPGMLTVEADGLPEGKVSIIIPTKDHADVLKCCVDSIVENAGGVDYEIVLVENNSTQQKTFDYYEEAKRALGRAVKVVVWEGPFNYSEIVNYGVAHSSGEFLLLLNNDTKAISGDFLGRMLMHMPRREVGVVGAKLLFADGLVQHCGMMIGPYGGISHVNQNYPLEKGGYDARACVTSEYSSVTGACQMMRREVFDEVGGYDPLFVVGFNDADFCLRVRQRGYEVVCEPGALLHHYEFVSRGRDGLDAGKKVRWEKEQKDFMARWPKVFECGDPFTTPNFDRNSWYYSLAPLPDED